MYFYYVFVVCIVQFDNDLVGQVVDGWSNFVGSCQIDFFVWSYFVGFDNGYIYFFYEFVVYFLCYL